jgi:hypothetical protein
MNKLRKLIMGLMLVLGLALVLPLPAWADWGPDTPCPGCVCSMGCGTFSNCRNKAPGVYIECSWTCAAVSGPCIAVSAHCWNVTGC